MTVLDNMILWFAFRLDVQSLQVFQSVYYIIQFGSSHHNHLLWSYWLKQVAAWYMNDCYLANSGLLLTPFLFQLYAPVDLLLFSTIPGRVASYQPFYGEQCPCWFSGAHAELELTSGLAMAFHVFWVGPTFLLPQAVRIELTDFFHIFVLFLQQ